jgi:hypothetical protein
MGNAQRHDYGALAVENGLEKKGIVEFFYYNNIKSIILIDKLTKGLFYEEQSLTMGAC